MSTPVVLHPDAAQTLGLAIVATSTTPMVLLDGDLTIIAASVSFCSAFGIDCDAAIGAKIAAIGEGEWAVPQLDALLLATASGAAEVGEYQMDLKRVGKPDRFLVMKALKLDYGHDQTRVVLTVVDITDARTAELLSGRLLQNNAILLQEIQHRVANSLQIIASVLLQSARRVTSNETRVHLTDAHSRVMSVAALQQQLASTAQGQVSLRSYFTDLCRSIGASMIADRSQVTLTVRSDDAFVEADASVSMGLIVTELVINALKHAFPNGRHGTVTVDYTSDRDDWSLSVTDDGVGMPVGTSKADAGLGTTIVQALAQKLAALVTIHNADPGTMVTVRHNGNAKAAIVQPL